MSIKADISSVLESLSEAELQQVADYVAFLRFRARLDAQRSSDATQLAARYAEFADEDRDLAEEGLAQYNEQLLA